MNAPFRKPAVLPPIPPVILAEAALDAWSHDRRAYDAGRCDDPAPWPYVHHTFEGDDAPTWSIRVVTPTGDVFVRAEEVRALRAARRPQPSPGDQP